MEAYLKVVCELTKQLDRFELTRIPRGENTSADALAALASTSDPLLKRVIPVEGIDKPSINIAIKSAEAEEIATVSIRANATGAYNFINPNVSGISPQENAS